MNALFECYFCPGNLLKHLSQYKRYIKSGRKSDTCLPISSDLIFTLLHSYIYIWFKLSLHPTNSMKSILSVPDPLHTTQFTIEGQTNHIIITHEVLGIFVCRTKVLPQKIFSCTNMQSLSCVSLAILTSPKLTNRKASFIIFL